MRISTGSEVKELQQQLSEVSQLLAAAQQEQSSAQAECSRLTVENKMKGESEAKLRLGLPLDFIGQIV